MADWKGILGGIAPTIATALGGSGAGALVAKLGQALLGSKDATPAQIIAAIPNATPEQVTAIQKLEQDFVLALADKAAEMEKVEAEDRANARLMQRETKSHTPAVITYTVLVLFAVALALSFYITVPPSNQLAVNAMVEVLKLLNVTAFGFWLGSSSGNRAKDAVVAKIAAAK